MASKRIHGHPARPAGMTGSNLMRAARLMAWAACCAAGLSAQTARGHEHAGECVEGREMSIMFEPGTLQDNGLDYQPLFVPMGGRWTETAYDGEVSPGDTFTITYSFVPDGTPLTTSYAPGGAESNLHATMDASFPGGMIAFRGKVAQAFARWGELSNITYVEVTDDGAAMPFAPGVAGVRGDVRIAMHAVGEGPLAYNYYPSVGGDMFLDSLDTDTFANAAGNFRNLRNVIAHEHGHGLGLAHVEPALNNHLMEPHLSTAFDGPQEDDIRGVQHLYGDWLEPNDASGEEVFVGDLRATGPAIVAEGTQFFANDADNGVFSVLTLNDLALERADSADWYGFTAISGTSIAVQVEPVGSRYEAGPQDGASVNIDAKGARDLGLRLWRRVSIATGEVEMLAQIDFNDAGEVEYHPPLPYIFAGYMYAEVYSNDGVNDAQRYRLTISSQAIEVPQADPALSVTQGLQLQSDGSYVLFADAAVGESSSVALTLHNGGEGPLTFPEAPFVQGPAAADFTVGDINGEIAPGGIGVLGITFTPNAEGVRVAVLTIPSNDPQQPDFSLIVRGNGLPAPEAPQPEPEPEPTVDCNANGIEDADDIAAGTSADCDGDGQPDECAADTDEDGAIDACDNCPASFNPNQADHDGNGRGDTCDPPANDGENEQSAEEEDPDAADGADPDIPTEEEDADAGTPAEPETPDDATEDGPVANDDPAPGTDASTEADPDEASYPAAGFCGAGTLAVAPLALAGLCGMRPRRRNVDRI